MDKIKQEIIETGKLMYQKGYNVSIDGNISVRLPGKELMITATGTRLGFLTEEDIVVTDYAVIYFTVQNVQLPKRCCTRKSTKSGMM
jgi:ribulose-5-phosphate 4-epimerase/fuculose-1-phosphate aldolase